MGWPACDGEKGHAIHVIGELVAISKIIVVHALVINTDVIVGCGVGLIVHAKERKRKRDVICERE